MTHSEGLLKISREDLSNIIRVASMCGWHECLEAHDLSEDRRQAIEHYLNSLEEPPKWLQEIYHEALDWVL